MTADVHVDSFEARLVMPTVDEDGDVMTSPEALQSILDHGVGQTVFLNSNYDIPDGIVGQLTEITTTEWREHNPELFEKVRTQEHLGFSIGVKVALDTSAPGGRAVQQQLESAAHRAQQTGECRVPMSMAVGGYVTKSHMRQPWWLTLLARFHLDRVCVLTLTLHDDGRLPSLRARLRGDRHRIFKRFEHGMVIEAFEPVEFSVIAGNNDPDSWLRPVVMDD